MPTNSATDAAGRESAVWVDIAERWHPDRNRMVWDDVPGSEIAVIPEVDPSEDLDKRASRWSYPMQRGDLADVALFAAALATTEAEAWTAGDRVLATQAFEERRFLVGDRILPWAVPWLRALGRCFPENRTSADETVAALLAVGEKHRSAPVLTGAEGLFLPGHDGFGPADSGRTLQQQIGSLWGGLVVFHRSLESMTGQYTTSRALRDEWLADPVFRATVTTLYEIASTRWMGLAARYPGTARNWGELAVRASETSKLAS